MNINSNELLLLSKKVKFGEEPAQQTAPNAVVTAPEETAPQTGMNALMFQGLKNVASDPQLATELKITAEEEPVVKEDTSAKEYTIPYQSNIAFQGKVSKFKNMAMAAMMGLAALGTVSTMTSCEDKVNQEVSVDMASFMEVLNELKSLRNDMANRDEQMAAKYDQLISMFQQVITLMQQQALDEQGFRMMVLANQDIIIDILTSNGMKQDEANAKLQEIINSNKTIAEKLEDIKNLVSDIKGLLTEAIANFQKYYEEMLAKQDELINTNKQGFEELKKRGDLTNETLEKLAYQGYELISLNEKQLEASNDIKDAIVTLNLDNNANFETVVEKLGIAKDELIAVMKKLGYSQEQVVKMTAGQIKAAIDRNTAVTSGTNMMLSYITKQLSILPELLKQNKITNEQIAQLSTKFDTLTKEVKKGNMSADAFYHAAYMYMFDSSVNQKVMISILIKNGKTEAEANKLLKDLTDEVKSGNKTEAEAFDEIMSKLDTVNSTLSDIKQILQNVSETLNKFYSDYKSDKKKEMQLIGGLYRNGKFQTAVLLDMAKTQKSMNTNLKGIKEDTDKLLEIAQDETKYNEFIDAIKNMQVGSVDYNRLEQMFKLLNMNLTNAMNMNASQLKQAILDFQKTYIVTEQKQTEELQTIQLKMDDLQIFLSNNANNKEIVNAINNLTTSVNQGKEDVTSEMQTIASALDKLQATVDAIYKSIGNQAAKVNSYFTKWDVKFNGILASLEGFKGQLSTIIANQKTAEAYLSNLLTEVRNLKAEVKKLQDLAGDKNISAEELEEMWQKHDAANYEKYSKLVKDLGLDFTTVEGLLTSIDKKMDNIKDNSDILNQILKKLNGIDWSNPNYNAKLDQIIELLKNFKCNCECGGNNEGIIDDLDKILG